MFAISCVSGLFLNNSLGFSEKFYLTKYSLEVTPADWTFYLSAIIYFWQLLWITYGVTSVCRTTDVGYVYRAFPVLPPILYVVFCFALACNISWLLIWDREYMEVALVFINLMTCNLYICLVASLRRLNDYGGIMMRIDREKDIWLVRILVHNGLALFATWGTVASMFNFAVVLTYRTGAKLEVGSTVALAIFTLEIIVWWVFDNFVFEKLLRYLFTPYIVILFSIAGIISKNWNPQKSNSIFTVSLFGVVVLFTCIKIVLSIYRHFTRPIFGRKHDYLRPMVSYEARHLLDS